MSLNFEQLRTFEGVDFAALNEIYHEAIPASERKPRDLLEAMFQHPNYKVIVGKLKKRVVSLSILYCFADPDFALLEYMAVQKSVRGQGVGSATFTDSAKRVFAELGGAPLVLEVDSDREKASDHDIRLKRIAFYRRLGCRRIQGLDYILPLATGETPPLMDLMIWQEPMPETITGVALRVHVQNIYIQVYQCHPTDNRLNVMISNQRNDFMIK